MGWVNFTLKITDIYKSNKLLKKWKKRGRDCVNLYFYAVTGVGSIQSGL